MINKVFISLLVCSFVLSLALVANAKKLVEGKGYFNKKVTPDDIMRVLGGNTILNMTEFTKAWDKYANGRLDAKLKTTWADNTFKVNVASLAHLVKMTNEGLIKALAGHNITTMAGLTKAWDENPKGRMVAELKKAWEKNTLNVNTASLAHLLDMTGEGLINELADAKIIDMGQFTTAWNKNTKGSLVAKLRKAWEENTFKANVASLAESVEMTTKDLLKALSDNNITNMAEFTKAWDKVGSAKSLLIAKVRERWEDDKKFKVMVASLADMLSKPYGDMMKDLSAVKITNMAEFTQAWDNNEKGTLIAKLRVTWELSMKAASLVIMLDNKESYRSIVRKLADVDINTMKAFTRAWNDNICGTYVRSLRWEWEKRYPREIDGSDEKRTIYVDYNSENDGRDDDDGDDDRGCQRSKEETEQLENMKTKDNGGKRVKPVQKSQEDKENERHMKKVRIQRTIIKKRNKKGKTKRKNGKHM